MNTKVSIIIRTYNEQKHIARLLDNIFAQNYKQEYEVIIVDSGSNDRTLEIARKYPVELVQIKSEDFTFGYSLNMGIKQAKGEYILMISAHCFPMDREWIKRMIEPFEKGDKVAVVYGKQRGKATTKYSEHQIFKTWFPDKSIDSQKTPFCNNANCAIRRGLWEKNKYNEKLTGLEDLDWAKEMLKRGYRICYQAEAGVFHIHDENMAQIYNRYKREAIAIKHIYPDLKFSFVDFVKLMSINVLDDLFTAIREGQIFKNFTSVIAFRFLQFWGTYKGHRFNKEIVQELKKKFYYPIKQ